MFSGGNCEVSKNVNGSFQYTRILELSFEVLFSQLVFLITKVKVLHYIFLLLSAKALNSNVV